MSGPDELDVSLATKRIGFVVTALFCWNVLLTATVVALALH